MKKKKIAILVVFIVFSTPFLISGQETEVEEYFKISLLSPNNNVARNRFSLLMQDQLPKIGIGIDIHESTTWGNIKPRTWMYPLIDYDYIPTYAQGGYDALFTGYRWDLDWNAGNLYTSGCMSSNENFYQYTNPQFDAKMYQYLNEMNPVTRIVYAHEIQAMLYEDLPAISIVYPRSFFVFSINLTGIDYLLVSLSKVRAENWDDPFDHIIKYPVPETLVAPNSFRESSHYDNKWMSSVYGSLFQRGQIHHEWEPVIALNYSLSSDKKNYTVILDPNAKFSNGSPILAEDVKYTYNLHMTPSVGSVEYRYLSTWLESNDSIEIVDPHTLNFNLTDTYAFSMELLSFGILDRSSVEPAISTYGYSIFDEEPLSSNVSDVLVKSCGPFMIENYTKTDVKLVQNPYWSDLNSSSGFQPKLTELHFNYLESKVEVIDALFTGIVDVLDPGFGIIFATFNLHPIEVVIVENLEHQEMAINMKHPFLGTGDLTPVGTPESAKYIRKAISHTIPREIIVDYIYEGLAYPGVTSMPRGCIGFDESLEPYAYDLDLAIEYMEDAGFEEIWHGTYTTPTSGFTISVMLFISIGLAYLSFYREKISK